LTIRLPQQLVPLLPPGENNIVLSDEIELVRADDNFQGLYPLETDGASSPPKGLLGLVASRPSSWEPSAEYLQISVNGFIGPYGGSTPAWNAESILRAFFGLGIALTLFKATRKYAWPFGSKPSSHFIMHRELSDHSWQYEGQLNLGDEQSRALDSLEKNSDAESGMVNYILQSPMRAVFSNRSKAAPVVLASEWFFNSHTGHDQLLSYVQAMVVLEILLGEKAASDEIGLGRLLSNRCAYLIGTTQEERATILSDFKQIYQVRSDIVHEGKSRLTYNELALFAKPQWFCHRVIYKEIQLLKPQ
jgi:GR25 family glycosyltransferase involved in LPS biosynthesis